MGCRQEFVLNGNVAFFGSSSVVLDCDFRKDFFENGDGFLFRSSDLTLAKQCLPAKQHNCVFLVLKKNIQNVAAAFALFTVVATRRFKG